MRAVRQQRDRVTNSAGAITRFMVTPLGGSIMPNTEARIVTKTCGFRGDHVACSLLVAAVNVTRSQRAIRTDVRAEMGGHLDGLRSRSLSVRQPLGAADLKFAFPDSRGRRRRSVVQACR